MKSDAEPLFAKINQSPERRRGGEKSLRHQALGIGHVGNLLKPTLSNAKRRISNDTKPRITTAI